MKDSKELSGFEAWEIDSTWAKENNAEPVYADEDDDGFYYVFGIETGFAYASYSDKDEAEKAAAEYNGRK